LDGVGRLDEAGAVYFSLAALPDVSLSMLFQAGNWLALAKLHDPAVQLYRAALAAAPNEVALLNNLANSLRELGRLEEAATAYDQALALLPDDPAILSNLGALAKDRGDLEEAVRLGLRAVDLGGDVLAHSNLGYAYYLQGEIEEAARWFDRAAEIAPGDPDAVFHQGVVDLAKGEWRRGWARYESRWRRRRATENLRHTENPMWDGGPLDGKTILVWSEQGLGDTLQFIRFAEVLAAQGATAIAEVQPPLVSLLSAIPSLTVVVAKGQAVPVHDVQCPLLSLPHALGLELDDFAPFHPYLHAPPAQAGFWRDWWGGRGRAGAPRIGLVWAGESRQHDVECLLIDRRRSMTLETLSPLLAINDIDFVSLQLGPARTQLVPSILDPMDHVGDFSDTAALIETLDAVVTVDTSVLHLAAAMGKPVFALSRYDGCWRWLLGRTDSPWYPTLRLYRQACPGQWGDVVEILKQDMVGWLQAR
jgi:Tfp pilus assembly protein PilF